MGKSGLTVELGSAGEFESEKTDAKRSIDPFVVASLNLALYKTTTCVIWCRTRVIWLSVNFDFLM
jgi:hypothetical protein